MRVENNPGLWFFALFRSVIGPENSRHSLNRSDVNLKPIATRSPAFSRAFGSLVGFILSSHWLFKILSFVVIGHNACFGFGFMAIQRKAPENFNQTQIKSVDHLLRAFDGVSLLQL